MEQVRLAVSGLILAGGQSSRMGRDKAWLEVDGEPLAQRLAVRVQDLVSEIIFSTNNPARFGQLAPTLPLPVQIVTDYYLDGGPLAGIHAGLTAASYELILALAVDMPFVKVPLLRYLASLTPDYDAVVPAVPFSGESEGTPKGQSASGLKPQGMGLEPLHAFYWRRCLPAVTAHLDAGERRVVSFLSDVRVRIVSPGEIAPYDPDFTSFRNVNTPEDWRAASE